MRFETGLLAALAGALACACSSGDGAGSGELSLDLTDKPLSHDLVESAVVHIDRITTHVSGGAKDDDEGGWVTLWAWCC